MYSSTPIRLLQQLRRPLSIAGKFNPTSEQIQQKNGDTGALCKAHNLRDCEDCFNWKKMLTKQGSKKGKAKAKLHKIADREQIFGSSAVDGGEPAVGHEAAERCPREALDCVCQSLPLFSDKFPSDLSTYPAWKVCPLIPPDDHSTSSRAIDRTKALSMDSAWGRSWRPIRLSGRKAKVVPATSCLRTRRLVPFHRQYFSYLLSLLYQIMSLANMYDEGQPTCVLQDEEGQEAICVGTNTSRIGSSSFALSLNSGF